MLKQPNTSLSNRFPKKIGKYIFSRKINPPSLSRKAIFGVYSSGNKKVFAKMVDAKRTLLTFTQSNYEKDINTMLTSFVVNKSYVKVPKLVDVYKNRNVIIMLFDFINGKTLEKLSPKERAESFARVFRFLDNFNHSFKTRVRNIKIIKRKPIFFIFSFPILFILSYARHKVIRTYGKEIIKTYLISIKSVKNSKLSYFTHRDLKENNVLKNSSGLWLTDFQIASITDPRHELSNLVFNMLHDTNFRKYFYNNNFIKNYIKKGNWIRVYKFYLMYSLLFESSFRYKLRAGTKSYIKHAFTLDKDLIGNIRYES